MTIRRILAASAAAILAAGLLVGCGAEKAPQLTAEQLQAGIIGGEEHPVNQEQAQAAGCNCHLQAQ